MKKLIAITTILIFCVSFLFGQDFKKYTSFSIQTGIQNPIEFALLDFSGYGPGDYFYAGPMVGLSIHREWKSFSLSIHADYLYNKLKLEEASNPQLHSLALNSKLWIVPISKQKWRVKAGLGAGIIPFRFPETIYVWEDWTDEPGRVDVYESGYSFTVSLNSAIKASYRINEKFEVSTSFSNDLVLYYGNLESALLTQFAVGIDYNF